MSSASSAFLIVTVESLAGLARAAVGDPDSGPDGTSDPGLAE